MIAATNGNGRMNEQLRPVRYEQGVRNFLESLAVEHRAQEIAERQLMESMELYGNLVDMREPYNDVDGEEWNAIGVGIGGTNRPAYDFAGFRDEQELSKARESCRRLLSYSEYAINGHQNRINYIIGKGHRYTVTAKKDGGEKNAELADDKGTKTSEAATPTNPISPQAKGGTPAPKNPADSPAVKVKIKAVQEFVDEFLRVNKWSERQAETQLRKDRDGEAFRRKFRKADGMTAIRFVEPWQVTDPMGKNEETTSFGIESEADDAETIVGYYVTTKSGQAPDAGDMVPADEIQHLKANVDLNVRRGVPLFYPVRVNLYRCSRIQKAIAARTEIAAALTLIRKHKQGTSTTVEQFATSRATVTRTNPTSGQAERSKQYGAGTVLDSTGNIDYEVPNIGFGLDEMGGGLQTILRGVAAVTQMPEFMFTQDASNANYSSTMVAEGPAVRSFERAQASLIEADKEIIDDAIKYAIEVGRLDADVLDVVEIQVEPPNLATRDKAVEAAADETYAKMGIKSPQTIASQQGLDYEQEQLNIEEHKAKGRMLASDPPAVAVDPNLTDENGNPLHPQAGGGAAKKPGAAGASDDKEKPGSSARRAAIKAQMEQATSPEEAIQIAIREAFV